MNTGMPNVNAEAIFLSRIPSVILKRMPSLERMLPSVRSEMVELPCNAGRQTQKADC